MTYTATTLSPDVNPQHMLHKDSPGLDGRSLAHGLDGGWGRCLESSRCPSPGLCKPHTLLRNQSACSLQCVESFTSLKSPHYHRESLASILDMGPVPYPWMSQSMNTQSSKHTLLLPTGILCCFPDPQQARPRALCVPHGAL